MVVQGAAEAAAQQATSAAPPGDLAANAVEVGGASEKLTIEGFAALPTHSRANSLGQYLFVNGRPVRDKLLIGVVRAAYADYLPRDRHPIVALFVTVDPHEVDVNVHPAKAEVRFRDPGLVRSLLIRALQEALARDGQRAGHKVKRPSNVEKSARPAGVEAALLPKRSNATRRRGPRCAAPPRPSPVSAGRTRGSQSGHLPARPAR